MSKQKLNRILLDATEAVSYNNTIARKYLVENEVDVDSFVSRGLKELGIMEDERPQLTKSQSFFRRLVLAARITDEYHREWTFGRVKFQKLVYLCEEASRMNFSTSYSKLAAGPFDNRFMHSVKNGFEKQKWFSIDKVKEGKYEKVRFTPLGNKNAYEQYYDKYYEEVKVDIEYLIEVFKKWKTDEVELVATLYYSWAEMNDEGKEVTENGLVEKVYAWHAKKKKFSRDQILKSIAWMKEHGIYPA